VDKCGSLFGANVALLLPFSITFRCLEMPLGTTTESGARPENVPKNQKFLSERWTLNLWSPVPHNSLNAHKSGHEKQHIVKNHLLELC